MRTVEQGTIIGECECASCGSTRPLKTTKKGTVGFRCGQWITNDDGTKHQCSGSSWLSKQASQKLINEYLNTSREEINDVQQSENRETTKAEGNDNNPNGGGDRSKDSGSDSGGDDREGNGIIGGLKHFLTGDD